MPRTIVDGEIRVAFVPTIADVAEPTPTEITAGTNITPFLRSIDTPLDGNAVNSSDLSSAFNKTVAGKYGGNISLEAYRDDDPDDDDAWPLFVRGTTGYVAIRRFGGSGEAIVAGDEVEVYHTRVITRSMATADEEALQMFSVDMAVLDEPELEAVVTV